MSEPKYVTYNVAKLLKEKGFDLPCIYFWFEKGNISKPSRKQFQIPFNWNNFESGMRRSAPLQSDVVDWLLEKHGIWVSVDTNSTRKWLWRINQIELDSFIQNDDFNEDYFNSPKEAYESAFKYTLTELI